MPAETPPIPKPTKHKVTISFNYQREFIVLGADNEAQAAEAVIKTCESMLNRIKQIEYEKDPPLLLQK